VVAEPPQPKNVHAGAADSELKEKIGREGARTIPGRPEHGGNCDIKNLSRGSKVFLPVHVKGAKFSVGDLHFSQGDGEISFCGAIEMAGVITIKFSVMKGGVKQLDMKVWSNDCSQLRTCTLTQVTEPDLHPRTRGAAVRTREVHLLRRLFGRRAWEAALPGHNCGVPPDESESNRVLKAIW
jgi:acetamidase/formamidase